MATISPLPGALSTAPRQPSEPLQLTRRWLATLVSPENSDVPATIAVATSCLAAAWCLGDLFSASGFLGLFSYRAVRVILYGAPFLFGSIIAAGYWSRSRAAHFLAVVATAAMAFTAFAFQFGISGPLMFPVKLGTGAALLAGVLVWGVRAVRRRLLPGNSES